MVAYHSWPCSCPVSTASDQIIFSALCLTVNSHFKSTLVSGPTNLQTFWFCVQMSCFQYYNFFRCLFSWIPPKFSKFGIFPLQSCIVYTLMLSIGLCSTLISIKTVRLLNCSCLHTVSAYGHTFTIILQISSRLIDNISSFSIFRNNKDQF